MLLFYIITVPEEPEVYTCYALNPPEGLYECIGVLNTENSVSLVTLYEHIMPKSFKTYDCYVLYDFSDVVYCYNTTSWERLLEWNRL